MTNQLTLKRWMGPLGFLVGLALVAVAVLGWRIPAGDGKAPLDLTLTANSGQALSVSPPGPVLRAGAMRPSRGDRGVTGILQVTNRSGRTVAVRLRALDASRHVDELLWVEISTGRRLLVRAPLGELRQWTQRPLELAPGAGAHLRLRAWLRRSMGDGWNGRIEDVTLQVEGRSTARRAGPR